MKKGSTHAKEKTIRKKLLHKGKGITYGMDGIKYEYHNENTKISNKKLVLDDHPHRRHTPYLVSRFAFFLIERLVRAIDWVDRKL